MEIKRTTIELKDLEQNTGQIAGVPKNPRQWSKEDVDLLAKSIDETPELLQMRPIIAVEQDGKYIIIGGNLRFSAVKKLGHKETDCYVLKDAAVSKIKEIAIKDNGSFGEWDFDELANCWDDLPLNDWGVDLRVNDDEDTDEYSRKIETPIYEPSNNKPQFYEMYNTAKLDELVGNIKAAKLDVETERFLIEAAHRHTIFSYEKIADFYSRAERKVQRLMEDSALVIIDFDAAIEKGFVELNKKMRKIYTLDYGEE